MKLLVAPALKDMAISIEFAKSIFNATDKMALVTCKNAAEKNHRVDLSAFDILLPSA